LNPQPRIEELTEWLAGKGPEVREAMLLFLRRESEAAAHPAAVTYSDPDPVTGKREPL
jgi:hypothetical protein